MAIDLDNYVVQLADIQEAKWIDGAWTDEEWRGPWEGAGSLRFVRLTGASQSLRRGMSATLKCLTATTVCFLSW